VQTAIDWRTAPPTDNTREEMTYWAATLNKVNRCWEFIGLDHCPHMHAHTHQGGPDHGIWAKMDPAATATRPEKLS
jgi:hypothetical protein